MARTGAAKGNPSPSGCGHAAAFVRGRKIKILLKTSLATFSLELLSKQVSGSKKSSPLPPWVEY